jgi:hypothetical protein
VIVSAKTFKTYWTLNSFAAVCLTHFSGGSFLPPSFWL